ncbi:hypothetical protein CDD83_9263 [Cordyceps sp. RAO-2017]|nr:hypothetical protein CDD83_9263 [Cordyceps sp. RAO-2017]
MVDRYRAAPPSAAGRSATFNPARASMPAALGYSSLQPADTHVMSAPGARNYAATPRGYAASSSASSGLPAAASRAYGLAPDHRQRPSTRETSRNRRSTLDSAPRPPVIITTSTPAAAAATAAASSSSSAAAGQKDRPHVSSSHSSNTRAGSPIRNEYRASDGQFYAQPASSIRSRSAARPYHIATAADEYGRFRDRAETLLSPREVDAYRSSRPSVVYPSDPRHSTAAIDYGDDGYQYTNAGELARYDLDLAKPSRPRRQESVDRGYYRPNVNYNADQRSFNVNTSHDLSRNYNMNTSRPYDGRAGPPPSTRGFDKISRAYDSSSRDLPPAAPVPPSPTAASHLDTASPSSERWEAARRPRPLSLHQDGLPRSSHHDDHHRTRDDERRMREPREWDREPSVERFHDHPRFKDESVAARGFGIRTDVLDGPADARDRRREARPDELRRRSDETSPEERHERRESRREEDGADKERSRFREKVAAGLSVAATAVGLVPAVVKDEEKKREPKRRRSPDEDRERRKDAELQERLALPEREREKERLALPEREKERLPLPEREKDRPRGSDGSPRGDSRVAADAVDRHRRDDVAVSSPDSDDGKRASHPSRASGVFNPNDASDLRQLKEQLAALDVSDRGTEGDRDRDRSASREKEKQQSRSPSPAKQRRSSESARDASWGRELALATTSTKQVRVVSPPRDRAEEKPLKGILKQPSARFPEDTNPVREGVAPHKEDKKTKEAPAGARWTKINRKIVNPEALTVGKERFEVRDDFVIVLRVLSKEEIQAYAAATQVLRERRRNKGDGDRDRDRDRDREADRDAEADGGRRHHRHHRHKDEDEPDVDERDRDRDHERERERERRRRHRRDDEDEYESRSREAEHHHPRSFRERERSTEV